MLFANLRSFAMRKIHVLLGTLLVCAVAGCSDDPNDILISHTISVLRGTTTDVEQVTKTLGDAVTTAKKESKPLDLIKINKAIQEAGGLKKKAQELQNLKAQTDVRKDNISAAQKEEFANKYKAPFQKALQDLDAAQKNLEVTMREAETVAAPDPETKSALEKLRDALKEAQNEFEVLTKRQS
jgi:predicted  nucleic acid-binding Zn-ribbon protein